MTDAEEQSTAVSTLILSVEPGAGLTSTALIEAWNNDERLSAMGWAERSSESRVDYFDASWVDVVVIPLAVNIASNIIYDLALDLIKRMRRKSAPAPQTEKASVNIHAQRALVINIFTNEESDH